VAEQISSTDLFNQYVNWTVQHFWDEVSAVKNAPIFFSASVVVVGIVLYFIFRWRYWEKLETRDETIRFVTATRDNLKLRLENAEADIQKFKQLPDPQRDPELAGQIAELKAEIEKRDSRNWRGLTVEEKQSLLFGIRRFKKTSIGIAYNVNPDCELLAADFRDVFANAEWDVMWLGSGAWASMGSVGISLVAENEAIGHWLTEVMQRTLGLNVECLSQYGGEGQKPANLLVVGPKRLAD